MNFKDIKPLTREGNYEVDIFISRVPTVIAEFERDYGLEMKPDFQREHKWTPADQGSYMEYLLRGGKTGRLIYFNHTHWGQRGMNKKQSECVCVDGLQRITAITAFLSNKVKCFGLYFKEFEGNLSMMNSLKFNMNSLPDKLSVLRWYLEINDTGVPHTKKELDKVRAMIAALEKSIR